jgi:hypothetical protein
MLDNLREVYIPAMIFSIILDFQLAIYFLYLYRKRQENEIGLNKFLLIFSNLFGMGAVSYVFLVIGSFYIKDTFITELFIRTGISILQGGMLVALLHLLSKPFFSLVNSKLIKILSVCVGASLGYLIFFNVNGIGLVISILIGLIGGGYFLYFQTKLVKLTSGTVHSRLFMTLIGEIVFLIGVFFGSGLPIIPFFLELKDSLYSIGSSIVNIGLIIILYGTFKFPGVLEFNWKKNLLKLYVVDARNLFELYSYDFTNIINYTDEKESNSINGKNGSINSIGVVGISDVFDEITKTYQNRIKKIKYGNFNILLDYEEDPNSQFLFVLFIDKNLRSLELFLNKVKNQFIQTYKGVLANFDLVDKFRDTIFSGFDLIIQDILD